MDNIQKCVNTTFITEMSELELPCIPFQKLSETERSEKRHNWNAAYRYSFFFGLL